MGCMNWSGSQMHYKTQRREYLQLNADIPGAED